MGIYMRFLRPGKIAEVSLIGFVLMMAAIIYGGDVAQHPYWGPFFTLKGTSLTWVLVIYGFIASVLPVWLLLAPRDYLSTFLKIGVIVGLAVGIVFAMPEMKMPAVTRFIDGTGPVFSGALFPFLFITIACAGDFRLSCAGFQRNHAKTRGAGKPHSLYWLRRDVDGVVCRHNGADLRLSAGPWRVFCNECPSGADWYHR